MDDDRTYRFTRRRGTNTANLRDVIAASDHRKTQDLPPFGEALPIVADEAPIVAEEASTAFAEGSQNMPCLVEPVPEPAPAPEPVTIERRIFAGVEIVVEHRGSSVTLVVPGASRLVGSRDEAVDLMAALLGPG